MTRIPPSPLACDPAALDEFCFLRGLVKARWVFFLLAVGLILAGHNGLWRVGRDSALYRQVAHNIAAGQGYTFRAEPQRHIYPGLPLLLAGIEKLAGHPDDPLAPTVSLLVMLGIALATLWCIHALVSEHFPRWVAVCVTTGVGVNHEFTQHAHEIMSDMPFLLGMCLAFLGAARLRRAASVRPRALAGAMLIGGVLIACSMRPTFWVLALAGCAAAMIGCLRHKRWKLALAAIVAAAAFVLIWSVLDPRGGPLHGKYERTFLQHLRQLGQVHWPQRLGNLFSVHIPEALLGFELPWWLGLAVTGLLFGSVARRIRYLPAWSLYVLIALGMLVVLGSNARYMLMILPMLLVEWALLMHALARRFVPLIRWRFTPDWVMLIGLALPTVVVAALSVGLVLEQHGYDRNSHYQKRPFLQVYRGGKMQPVLALADAVRQHVPANRRVLGPEARIVTFLSGRSVYEPAEVFGQRKRGQWAAALRHSRITYVVWGPGQTRDRRTTAAIRRRIIQVQDGAWWPIEPLTSGGPVGMYIGKLYTAPPTTLPTAPHPTPPHLLPGLDQSPRARPR